MGPFVYINMSTAICCLLFSVFLSFIYFGKKNMNNIENKIYRHLLILNNIELVLSLIYDIFAIMDDYSALRIMIRVYAAASATCISCIFFYILVVSNENNKKIYQLFNKKSTFIYFYLILIVECVLNICLPLSTFVINKGELYEMSGLSIYFYYICMGFPIISSIVVVAINKKNINNKKIIPFYVMLIFGIVALVTYVLLPQYFVLQLAYTIEIYLMVFTIENPDMKLITELEFAKDQAEKSNNAKSDFLSSMSHELRTPLNAIVGLSQIIVTSDNLDEIHNDGQDILKSSNNLLELVDSILDINKIDSNNMEIVEKNYNPIEVFNDLEKITRMRIGDKNIELNTRYSDKIPNTLFGDKDKVKTIINNILTNAVKYTNEGFVEFNVDCTTKEDICNLRITITDSGRGISEDQMNNLFTKFYRREEDKDSDIEGTGLGLALTKALLDLMGGKITVNSEEGIGSTFTITLSQKIINTESDTEVL